MPELCPTVRSTATDAGVLALRSFAFDRLSASAVVLDGAGVILDTNEAWRLFTHLNDGRVGSAGPGVDYLDVCDRAAADGADGAAAVAAGLREILQGEREQFDLEYACPSPTEDRWFLLQASFAPVADGAGVVLFHVDITTRKLLADHLAGLAEGDMLTGLPNRRSAVRFIEEQLSAARTTGCALSVLFLDLDRFKAVNDRFGHHVGDELLVKVAARARRTVREQDRLCRFGGDEFVLVCPGLDRGEVAALAARLDELMAEPFQVGATEVSIGISIGIASSRSDSTADSLLNAADTEMYVAKRRTRRHGAVAARTGRPTSSSPHVMTQLRGDETSAWLWSIVESSNDAIFSTNHDGLITTWNRAAADLYGFTDAEIVGRHFSAVVPPERADAAKEIFRSVLHGETVENFDSLGRRSDGGELHVSVSVSPIRAAGGAIVGTSTIVRDVTERVELLQRIETDRRRLADAQASASLGSFELDLDTGQISRSDEFLRIVGIKSNDSSGVDLDRVHPDDRIMCREFVDQILAGQLESECTHRIVRPDGVVRWVITRTQRTRDAGSRIVAGTMLDITERHEAELALAHQATHDSMTQLLNRTSMNERLEMLLSAPDRRQPIAVAFLDVDEFKQINDRVGHAVGDQTLRAVAGRLRAGLREDDIIGRIGGDEFVLLRPGVNTLDEARALAEESMAALRTPLQIGEHEFQVTASIGVTVSNEADSPTSLIRDADDAMYQAKRDGKARIAVFDRAARTQAQRRRTLANELRHTLANDELHLEYQPILDLSSLDIAGFESLLRWNHPTLGAIAPDEFVPIAETIGLIVPIGNWVLDHAFRQLAEWRDDSRVRRDVWMAVNLSAQQLGQPHLVERIAGAIDRAGVPPSLIHLEVTETVLMDDVDSALGTIIALKERGVRVSIDDFGTGYSSLSYLSRLPIDTIKIDRSFLRDLGTTGHDRSIVRAMTALADALDLDVVAEGIELPDQLRVVRELGCAFGQGFLWSRPLDPDAALEWMIATDESSADAAVRSPDPD